MSNAECANDHPGEEWVAPVGYLNAAREHALISIYNPPLLNAFPEGTGRGVQVALSIDGAVKLRAALNAFLSEHGLGRQ